MILLPTTLSAAAAAALIAFWLSTRVAMVRRANKVAHGDGGVPALGRRMRAQMNFVEYTPFVLILCALIELSGRGGLQLALAMAVYMLARVAHAFGMDGDGVPLTRQIGIGVTFFVLLGLAVWAVIIAAGVD